ncbi:MAG TPA: Gfo/Idh/MocA family oxidoreductase [Bryobacteraceae bacterium]|nr:Gfo/Idh/MocA family oxidoreductase [Bryobacteraceae bacterium]
MEPQNYEAASRRDFLKAAAPAMVLGSLPLPLVHAAGSDVIRVGVIGCGGRGEAAAMNAMNAGKDVRIVAMGDILLDRVQEKRSALRLKYPGQVDVPDDRCFAGFGAYRQVIEASDVVIIANAAKFHSLHAKTAIEAGRHVFVEKPHAIDPVGINKLRAACELAKVKGLSIVSGLQSRYHPGYIDVMKRVHDGAIGEVVAIQETWLRPPYVLYPRRPGMKEIEYQASNQYHFHWLSGDDVPQTLIHNLDRSSWALHNAAPTRCYGMGGRSTLKGEVYGDVFDHHAVVYDFPQGVRVYAFCRTIDNCYNENSSLILGTKGRCDLLQLRITGETNWESQAAKSKADAYDLEHVALFTGIRKGAPVNNGDYMVRSTQIGLLGQFSCYTGQQVTWDQFNKSDFYYPPLPENVAAETEPPVAPGPDGNYPVLVPGVTRLL